MNLIFTYNVKHRAPSKNNDQALQEAEFDAPKTIAGIKKALESLGHRVFLVEADERAYAQFKKLKREGKADLVFNYAEGLRGADREAQIPAMLEMLGIPYTGPTPLGYALGLNKTRTKEIWKLHKIPTPRWQVVTSGEKITLPYPLIVKPEAEGSSKGIFVESLVKNRRQLDRTVRKVIRDYRQPALVEAFLPGREFAVGVVGTPPEVLPLVEVTFNELPKKMPRFDHYEAKWLYDNPRSAVDPLICPAEIGGKLEEKIKKICLQAFAALGLRDWARFDVRLDKKGMPYLLEVNCPPGINPDPWENSRIVRAALVAGYTFPQLLEKVIASAARRGIGGASSLYFSCPQRPR